ncbi:MAG: TetR/AcrR family transcriptional regulator [Acidimicrobiales bacterium]
MTRPVAVGADAGPRGRILDTALSLMSQRGSAGTSMRRLASVCGLNVATIYHYFPSKADLLRALIEERRYGERLATEEPAIDAELPPAERMAAFVRWVAERTLDEEVVLRLLLGEALRGDATARDTAVGLLAELDVGLTAWLARGFPELDARGLTPEVAARLVRRSLLALVTEHLATGSADVDAHATELAGVMFGSTDGPTRGSPNR